MRKPSMMGSSKYEFNPGLFELDIKRSQERYSKKLKVIKGEVSSQFEDDPTRMKETYQMYVSVLLDMKKKFNL